MPERKSVLVRLRPEIYEELRRWAAADFRSVNGQIEFLLHESLRKAGRKPRRTDADADADADAGAGRGANAVREEGTDTDADTDADADSRDS